MSQTQRDTPGPKLDYDLEPNDSIGEQAYHFDIGDELDRKL